MIATPTEIEYFIEVYQTQHVSKAAIRLGITQPTLTQSLQKLEEKLRAKLFHRTKQGVTPTASGILFYKNAHALVDSWRNATDTIHNNDTELQGRFRLGCHQSVGAYVLPRFFKNLNQDAPKVEIDLIHDFSRKITEQIISYQIDFGFVVNPVRHPDLVLKKIGNDRVAFWKKKGLAPVPQKIFADINLHQIREILGKCHAKTLGSWGLISTHSLELIRTLVLSGQGIGILPERVAKADGADLVIYDSKLPTFDDEIYLAYRKDAVSSRTGKELIRIASIAL